MSKRFVLVAQTLCACSALVGLSPSVGHAHEIRVSSYEMSESGGIVVLESDAPIGDPWLRVEAKSVRVWFPNVAEVARFDHQREADEPIRALVLRPGAQDSAVVRMEAGTGRTLTRENIKISRDGLSARIQVSFPSPSRAPVVTRAAAAAPAPSKPVAVAAPASASPLPPPSAAKPLVLADPSAPAPSASKPSTSATGPAKASIAYSGASNQNIGLLMMISAALLAVYVCIRKLKPRAQFAASNIEVLSARSLGKGSQLLLVRALGSDHLLVTSQGRVECVAREPSRVDIPLEKPATATLPAPIPLTAADESHQAEGLGVFTKLSSRSRLRKLLDSVDKETSESEPPAPPVSMPAPAKDSRRPSFGPELLSAMNQHRLTGLSSLPSIANKQSDAVAGIARLRSGTRIN